MATKLVSAPGAPSKNTNISDARKQSIKQQVKQVKMTSLPAPPQWRTPTPGAPVWGVNPDGSFPQPGSPGAIAGMPTPPPPPDPTLDATRSNLTRAYNDANATINYDEQRTKQDYGFDDTSNPFNRAALLQQSYQDRQRGTLNGLAARGQLYSGAMLNQQTQDTRAYDQAYSGLRTSYEDAIHAIFDRRRNAQTAYDTGNADALAQSTQRSIDNRPDPTTLAPSPAAADAPTGTLTAALERRKKRAAAGITDIRKLTPAQKKKLKAQGLLP